MIPFKSPAKINVGLFVSTKRTDGYHPLDTLFFGIDLFDRLHIQASKQFCLSCTSEKIPIDDRNIITKSWNLFSKYYPASTSLKIHLEKNLPSEAGIGGASGNAALILWVLNQINGNPFSIESLNQLALSIGADVPFFLQQTPCFAQGIGEVFTCLPMTKQHHLVLIKPSFSIKTSDAFDYLDNVNRSKFQIPQDTITSIFTSNDLHKLDNVLSNDFELIPGDSSTQISSIKQSLKSLGASFSSLSGSGSCVYGFFENLNAATTAHRAFKTNFETYLCRTLIDHSPEALNSGQMQQLLSSK